MTVHALAVFCKWLIHGSAILAGVSGILRFRHLPQGLRYVALLAIFDMLMELILRALIQVFHFKSNLFLVPFIVVGEVLLLSLAYREVLQSATFNRVMPWVVGLLSVYALANEWVGLGTVHYTPSVEITADLLQLMLAGLYFWKLLQGLHVERLRYEPFFWLSVGLVMYVLGDLLITLFSNYLLNHYSYRLQLIVLLIVRPLFVISLSCCYTLALWMRPRKVSSFSY